VIKVAFSSLFELLLIKLNNILLGLTLALALALTQILSFHHFRNTAGPIVP